MNATFQFRDQLYGAWENARGYLADGLDLLGASIAAGYYAQHNQDDTHGTITATGSVSERSRTTPMGEWITPAFNAANFATNTTDAWVVTPSASTPLFPIKYMLIGKTLFLSVYVVSSAITVTGATKGLRVKIPGGFTALIPPSGSFASHLFRNTGELFNNSMHNPAIGFVLTSDPTWLEIRKIDDTVLVTDSATNVTLQIYFEIVG